MKNTGMSVWVPTIICEKDIEFHISIQDLMDCVLSSRESALEFFTDLTKRFKKEWFEIEDVSPYWMFETKEECDWYGWEFEWVTPEDKKYECTLFLQQTPIYC